MESLKRSDMYQIVIILDQLKSRIAILITLLNGLFLIFSVFVTSTAIMKSQNKGFKALWFILLIFLFTSILDIFLWPHCRRITKILIENPFELSVLNENKYIKNDYNGYQKPLLIQNAP